MPPSLILHGVISASVESSALNSRHDVSFAKYNMTQDQSQASLHNLRLSIKQNLQENESMVACTELADFIFTRRNQGSNMCSNYIQSEASRQIQKCNQK